MAIEIERKFLVVDDAWRSAVVSARAIRQGYVSRSGPMSTRIRLVNGEGWLTIKSRLPGLVRAEFEYAIPIEDALAMLSLCEGPLIEKVRHTIIHAGREWAVDEFEGERQGLVLAECELARPDEQVVLPPWAGAEVTDDPAYRNEAIGGIRRGAASSLRWRPDRWLLCAEHHGACAALWRRQRHPVRDGCADLHVGGRGSLRAAGRNAEAHHCNTDWRSRADDRRTSGDTAEPHLNWDRAFRA